MKSLVVADLHLSSYGDKDKDESDISAKLFSILKVMKNVMSYGLENKIYNVIILGDIFHTKSIIHTIAQSSLLDFIRKYKNMHFYIIDGNHDMSEKGKNGVSALKCLDSEENVTTFHKSAAIDNMFFVPWQYGMVDIIKENSYDYLFSHFGLNEASLSSGISIVSDVGLRDVKQYKHVILGHYHKPQEISNVTYVGSVIQLDWNEKGEEKRFLVIDNEKHTIESIPTTGYKKYIELNLNNDNREDIIKKGYEEKENGNYVKISRSEVVDIDDIQEDFVVIDRFEKDVTNRGLTLSMSSRDKFNRYMEIKEIPDNEREEYSNEAISIIDSVVEKK